MKRKYVRILMGILCAGFFITGCGNSETTSKSESSKSEIAVKVENDNSEQDALADIRSILNNTKENIKFIKSLTELTVSEDNSINITEEEKQKIESMMLFGYDGSLSMQTMTGESHINQITWKSKDEASDTEYDDMESGLGYLYGQSGAKPEGVSGYYWSTSDVNINLKQEDDDGVSRIIIDFQFKSGNEENEDSDTTAENANESGNSITDNDENITCSWEDGEAPTEVGNDDSKALIENTKIINSSYGELLVMDFKYTNNAAEASDFINDINCKVRPYQNGIELDRPGITSESGVYDYGDAYTDVKDGGAVSTQLVWVLKDTINPIEIDFGINSDYDPAYSKKLILSGGKEFENSQAESQEAKESDYNVSWVDDNVPEKIGNDDSYAILKNTSAFKSSDHGIVLVMDFEYTNNRDKARDLINDVSCKVKPYQNGVELDTPGITSESGVFNYSDAFTNIKNGGTIETQLVWVLKDDKSPVKVEFGLDSNYNPQYNCTLNISAK